MIRLFFVISTVVLLQVSSFSAVAEQQFNLDDEGRALHGYDPVSYFTGTPEKGNGAISHDYHKVKYLFASQENLEEFLRNPEKYQFAYGGYCAWAMLEGEKVDVDPERYKMINGVVYLFYNTFFTDTLEKWNDLAEKESEQKLVERANGWWQKMVNM